MFKQFFNVFKQFIKSLKKTDSKQKEKNKSTTGSRSNGYMSSGNVHADMKRTRNRKRNKVARKSRRLNILIARGEL